MPADIAIRRALAAAGIELAPRPRRRDWDDDAIAAAFRRYRDATGYWPTADACNPSRLRRAGRNAELAAFHTHGLPYVATVYLHFGAWPAAIAHAEKATR